MTKLTTTHPAVVAAMMEMTKGSSPLTTNTLYTQALNEALKVLEAALPHLTDDIPHSTEEVDLPSEFGDIIYDVEADFGETVRFDHMVWTGFRWASWDHLTVAKFIIAFTLPDGTRARRDGEREDGKPRFVKVDDK